MFVLVGHGIRVISDLLWMILSKSDVSTQRSTPSPLKPDSIPNRTEFEVSACVEILPLFDAAQIWKSWRDVMFQNCPTRARLQSFGPFPKFEHVHTQSN